MNFPSTPPEWMNAYPAAKKAWQRFALRCISGPIGVATQKQVDLLVRYCSLVSDVVTGESSPAMEKASRSLDELIMRSRGMSQADFNSRLRETLNAAQSANNMQTRKAQLAKLYEDELSGPAYNTDPDLRLLCRAVLFVGGDLLSDQTSKPAGRGRKITIVSSPRNLRIRNAALPK